MIKSSATQLMSEIKIGLKPVNPNPRFTDDAAVGSSVIILFNVRKKCPLFFWLLFDQWLILRQKVPRLVLVGKESAETKPFALLLSVRISTCVVKRSVWRTVRFQVPTHRSLRREC